MQLVESAGMPKVSGLQAPRHLFNSLRTVLVKLCHNCDMDRRVFLKDLLDYKKLREQTRREAIVRIARQSEDLGDYNKFVPPEE
jgi:hypothetical protein